MDVIVVFVGMNCQYRFINDVDVLRQQYVLPSV